VLSHSGVWGAGFEQDSVVWAKNGQLASWGTS